MSVPTKIGPWRTQPVRLSGRGAYHGRIWPSGRQALTAAVRALGLGRADRVAIPEWSSHCVISAIGAVATPIPMREAREPAAVLVYDQWGWPRKRWPKARIIHDCVDTASLEFSEADTQIWSLSKVLGLLGGGLLRVGHELVEFNAEDADREMGGLPPDLRKSFVRWLPPEIVEASDCDLDAAFARERERRAENLAAIRGRLPAWMDAVAAPGLYPLEVPDLAAGQQALLRHGIDAPIYHFDFAGDPVQPDYRKCLAVPLHGEVSPDLLRLS